MTKTKVYSACMEMLEEKISGLNDMLHELTAGAEDAKSSAGDKHETARAMMQLEHEKISRQLEEAMLQKEMLQRTRTNVESKKIITGSLVNTDKGFLFLSIPLGKIFVDKQQVIVLSPQSPLGKQLIGLPVSGQAVVNNVSYKILAID